MAQKRSSGYLAIRQNILRKFGRSYPHYRGVVLDSKGNIRGVITTFFWLMLLLNICSAQGSEAQKQEPVKFKNSTEALTSILAESKDKDTEAMLAEIKAGKLKVAETLDTVGLEDYSVQIRTFVRIFHAMANEQTALIPRGTADLDKLHAQIFVEAVRAAWSYAHTADVAKKAYLQAFAMSLSPNNSSMTVFKPEADRSDDATEKWKLVLSEIHGAMKQRVPAVIALVQKSPGDMKLQNFMDKQGLVLTAEKVTETISGLLYMQFELYKLELKPPKKEK